MEKMLPPSKGLSNKILLEKAVKFGINKKTAEGLLRNNEYKSLTQMIDKRIEVKTNEMLKKSDQIFKKLNRNSKKSKTSNTKRETLLRNQNFELKVLKEYFKEESKKLNKRGPPLQIPNRLLTSSEIRSIEKNAIKKIKDLPLPLIDLHKRNNYPNRVRSGVSVNDPGYDAESSESSIDFHGFKRKTKRSRKSKRSKRSRKSKKSRRSRR